MFVNRAYLDEQIHARLLSVLRFYFPDGKIINGEFEVRNYARGDRRTGSFKFNTRSYFWSDFATGETTAATTGKPGRIEHSASRPELKEFVKKDAQTGEDRLASYDEAWDDGRFEVKDGMRIDKFGNKYADTPEGKDKFKESSRKFWSDLADKTKNEELRRDTQTGKMDSPMNKKKKKGWKMKGSPFLNYKKGYYGAK